jgi:hypothetical protein
MFKLTTEASLLATFRYGDRRRVELSREVTLPIVVNDYLTWVFGKRVFLVFALPGNGPRGIGILVCSDLGCRDRLEYVANRMFDGFFSRELREGYVASGEESARAWLATL